MIEMVLCLLMILNGSKIALTLKHVHNIPWVFQQCLYRLHDSFEGI